MKTIQSKDGTTLAYDVYGSGPALIYITGASCFRSFMPIVQDALTKAIPGATFIQLAGQDHMVSAKALLPVLASFLKPQPQLQTVKLSS